MKELLTLYDTKYRVEGMTCQACADSIESTISTLNNVSYASVSLSDKELIIQSDQRLDLKHLNSAISTAGDYKILSNEPTLFSQVLNYFDTKKPILIALVLVSISSLSLQVPNGQFYIESWFTAYMGIFFLLFSFLKLLNVSGFSMTFKRYDVISKQFAPFATIYPFIELSLGLAFLTQSFLVFANIATILFMISQSVGVIQVMKNRENVQCACMGTAISLPISSLTLFENLVMVSMATYMLLI